MLKKTLLGILVASGFLATAQAQDNQAQTATLPKDVAGQCQISFIETPHLKLGDGKQHTGWHSFCGIHLKNKEAVTAESISVLFSPRNMDVDDKYGVGFLRIPGKLGQWDFVGTQDVLLDSHFLKRSFTHDKDGDDELLVGDQLIRGYIAQGGPLDLPGIRILRLTPQFAISVELDYQPTYYEKQTKGYKALREAVSKELIEIVKSIQPTPGQAGPTVRQP